MDIQDYAKAYISAGWPVLAVHSAKDGICSCGDASCKSVAKHPKLEYSPNGVNSATTDLEEVERWQDCNIGIALGARAGGLMALDIDEQEIASDLLADDLGLIDETSSVRTGRPGLHIFFISRGETATRIIHTSDGRRVGEMRGDGAYVVAPPSIAATGREYRMLGRTADNFAINLAVTQNPKEYVQTLLSWVDVVAVFKDSDKKRELPDSKIAPTDIPEAFATSHHVTQIRQHLAMEPGSFANPKDRSTMLQSFAYKLRDAAQAANYSVTLEEIASVLRKCDLVFTKTKYDWRHDASHYYLEMAATALDVASAAPELESGDTLRRVASDDYSWDNLDGWLYYQPEGSRTSRKVCNFLPTVVEEITTDYGGDAKDNKKSWLVSFSRNDELVTFEIKMEDLRPDKFETTILTNCSISFVVEERMHGRLRAALQLLSQEDQVRKVRKYAHTGWTERGGKRYYLLPGADGAIGPDGITTDLMLSQDRLDEGEPLAAEAFSPYGKMVRPAETALEKEWAWRAFKALIDCGDHKVTLPVVLQVLTGPLLSMGLDASTPTLHVMGRTGSLKTSYCKSALSLFGQFTDSPPPIAWAKGSSSKAYILLCLSRLKDLPVLIDDYKRRFANPTDVAEIVQTIADKTARGRARNNQTVRTSAKPRGLILSNGEDMWESEASAESRTITVNLKKGDIDEHLLFGTVTSAIRLGWLQMFGGAWLKWLAAQDDLWVGGMSAHYERLRDRLNELAGDSVHLRVPATLATLVTTLNVLRSFVRVHFGEEAYEEISALAPALLSHRLEIALQQAEQIEAMSPFNELMMALVDGITGREICFWPADGIGKNLKLPDVPLAKTIGVYFTNGNGLIDSVLLTEKRAGWWYLEKARRRGEEPGFTWRAVEQEAIASHRAHKVKQKSVYIAGTRSQLSGIVLPIEEVSELIYAAENIDVSENGASGE